METERSSEKIEETKIGNEPQNKPASQSFWELVRFVAIALAIVVLIRTLIITPFVVSGSSMVPTFSDGNYLIIDKLSYRLGEPGRGDVIIFLYPGDPKNDPQRNALLRFFNPGRYFIKRIIGLPNETVDILGSAVTVTNAEDKVGFKLDEPYVKNIASNITHFELKSDEYFVMGDNRSGSSDSRVWGPVKREFITGRAFLRLLPVNKMGILPGNYKETK